MPNSQNFTDGLILVDKPIGWTSFDVTRVISKALQIKKVGHSGTLDKSATGLLLVCFGKATKLLTYLIGLDKRYIAEITFGTQTTTDDATGEVLATYNGTLDENVIKNSLNSMIGSIDQTPPKYSSVHIDGKRAYKLATQNVDFTIKSRTVTIYDLSVGQHSENVYSIDVRCSSGTYIRSIARDVGLATGYFAHISSLRRMSIADFKIEQASTVDQIKAGTFSVLTPKQIIEHLNYPILTINKQFCSHFIGGKTLTANLFEQNVSDGLNFVVSDEKLLGLIEKSGSQIKYKFVY